MSKFRRIELVEAEFLPEGESRILENKDGAKQVTGPCWIRTDKCGQWAVDMDWFRKNHAPSVLDYEAHLQWEHAYPDDTTYA